MQTGQEHGLGVPGSSKGAIVDRLAQRSLQSAGTILSALHRLATLAFDYPAADSLPSRKGLSWSVRDLFVFSFDTSRSFQ